MAHISQYYLRMYGDTISVNFDCQLNHPMNAWVMTLDLLKNFNLFTCTVNELITLYLNKSVRLFKGTPLRSGRVSHLKRIFFEKPIQIIFCYQRFIVFELILWYLNTFAIDLATRFKLKCIC